MLLSFWDQDRPPLGPEFVRDLPSVPQKGDYIINHKENGSFYYIVVNVIYINEYRKGYTEKEYTESYDEILIRVKKIDIEDIP